MLKVKGLDLLTLYNGNWYKRRRIRNQIVIDWRK